MALMVMKFGGSSVADAEKIKHVANIIIKEKKNGNAVVVVVSAPGDTTDDLIEMADKITNVISEVGKVPKELVHILFIDLPKTNIAKGGIIQSDK